MTAPGIFGSSALKTGPAPDSEQIQALKNVVNPHLAKVDDIERSVKAAKEKGAAAHSDEIEYALPDLYEVSEILTRRLVEHAENPLGGLEVEEYLGKAIERVENYITQITREHRMRYPGRARELPERATPPTTTTTSNSGSATETSATTDPTASVDEVALQRRIKETAIRLQVAEETCDNILSLLENPANQEGERRARLLTELIGRAGAADRDIEELAAEIGTEHRTVKLLGLSRNALVNKISSFLGASGELPSPDSLTGDETRTISELKANGVSAETADRLGPAFAQQIAANVAANQTANPLEGVAADPNAPAADSAQRENAELREKVDGLTRYIQDKAEYDKNNVGMPPPDEKTLKQQRRQDKQKLKLERKNQKKFQRKQTRALRGRGSLHDLRTVASHASKTPVAMMEPITGGLSEVMGLMFNPFPGGGGGGTAAPSSSGRRAA